MPKINLQDLDKLKEYEEQDIPFDRISNLPHSRKKKRDKKDKKDLQ